MGSVVLLVLAVLAFSLFSRAPLCSRNSWPTTPVVSDPSARWYAGKEFHQLSLLVIKGDVKGDPAVFSLSRENPPLDVSASPSGFGHSLPGVPLRVVLPPRSIVVVLCGGVAAGRPQPA